MSYCNGNCEHLNEKKHKCELTGEKLTVMKYRGAISYTAHEHRGFCDKDKEVAEDE
ncbi:MAG: hypothetical protein ACI4ES_12215 [Roseburia sp.]